MSPILSILVHFAATASPQCTKSFLGFPTWFKYLETNPSNNCAPILSGINDIWLIGLAAIEILLRVVIIIAIIFVMYSGIQYSNSGANTDKMRIAKNTLIDALAGLIIAMVATAAVSFVAGRFVQS